MGGLQQKPGVRYRTEEQVAILMALSDGLLEGASLDLIHSQEEGGFLPFLRREHPTALDRVGTHGVGPVVEQALRDAIRAYRGQS